jgi:SAM-dependent methyltransferase
VSESLRQTLGRLRASDERRALRRAAHAIDGLARARLRPDNPWLTEYQNLLSEEFLAENVAHHQPFVELVEELAAVAAPGRAPRLLEAGAGSAAFALVFSRRNYEVWAVDSDPLMVLRAQHVSARLGGFARIVCMDLHDLGRLRPDAFDVAFSQGTLEHFPNDEIHALLARQLDVARHVVFSVPSVQWPSRDFLNERKMSLDEWKSVLAGVDAELLELTSYQQGRHVLAALRRREPSAS